MMDPRKCNQILAFPSLPKQDDARMMDSAARVGLFFSFCFVLIILVYHPSFLVYHPSVIRFFASEGSRNAQKILLPFTLKTGSLSQTSILTFCLLFGCLVEVGLCRPALVMDPQRMPMHTPSNYSSFSRGLITNLPQICRIPAFHHQIEDVFNSGAPAKVFPDF